MTDQISKYDPSVLMHHGVKGQKWGVRRYQNPDGSLTNAGRKHAGYSESSREQNKAISRAMSRTDTSSNLKKTYKSGKSSKVEDLEKVKKILAEKAVAKHKARKEERAEKKRLKAESKAFEKEAMAEARRKVSSVYDESTKYAEKHGIDPDDIVDEHNREAFVKHAKENGLTTEQAKRIVKYNELLDAATAREEEVYSQAMAEARKKIADFEKSKRRT